MSDLRQAAQQALQVLERAGEELRWQAIGQVQRDLRAALAEPQYPEIPWGKAIGVEQKRGCRVCGIGADGQAYGYVCSRSDCPTRVTCGGSR